LKATLVGLTYTSKVSEQSSGNLTVALALKHSFEPKD
jgi:hypothetical protein